MSDIIFLISGIVGLISGVLILRRPMWFRNLWKIRTAYEYWGGKTASRYFCILGILTMAIGLWLIIEYFS